MSPTVVLRPPLVSRLPRSRRGPCCARAAAAAAAAPFLPPLGPPHDGGPQLAPPRPVAALLGLVVSLDKERVGKDGKFEIQTQFRPLL